MKTVLKLSVVLLLLCGISVLFSPDSFAGVKNAVNLPETGNAQPDLFTGTLGYSIPIEVPEGRHEMQPNLALTYHSSNGNGWIGVGWELEVGAIERSTKFGVDYSGDDYALRMSGATIKLLNIGNNEYRTEVEDGFYRIRKLTASDGRPSWEVTDKKGTRYLYGQSISSRQDDAANASRIFKWCIDYMEDTNGNFMSFSYVKDQGEIYLDQINYAGSSTLASTNHVKFYSEIRNDAPKMNTLNFEVKTAYRLKTVEVVANGNRVRAYRLEYDADPRASGAQYSINTGRSVLAKIQQFGKDATLDASGMVTGGTALPAIELVSPMETNGFEQQTWSTTASNWGSGKLTMIGDFDGDGKNDIATLISDVLYPRNEIWIKRSTGASFVEEIWYKRPVDGYDQAAHPDYTWVGDFNGDGKADIATVTPSATLSWKNFRVWRSTGTGFAAEDWGYAPNWGASGYTWVGDFNGDGMADIATASGGTIWVKRSTGFSFVGETWTITAPNWGSADYTRVGDFNGDGKDDIATASGGTIWVKQSKPFPVDVITAISNGIGGLTTITYIPSTQYKNTLLPFPVQTVSAITACDNYDKVNSSCVGNSATTNYTYKYGYYYIPDRDFRGFNYAKVTPPAGPNGEQGITETWFHQGNDTQWISVDDPTKDVMNPKVPVGYMKGKPYRTRLSDGFGLRYNETATNYAADNTAPYFNPPLQLDVLNCEKDVCSKQTRAAMSYDEYGNVIREDKYGDISASTDDHTVVRSYGNNTTSWILGLPIKETIFEGTYPGVESAYLDPTKKLSETEFYYDGPSDCSAASSNQMPKKGNLSRTVRWYSDGASPEIWAGYDAFGNLVCTRDAKGYVSTIAYDSTFTFPTIETNPKGHKTVKKYYGVDGMPADKGAYGQLKSITDPNLTATTAEYDPVGRKTSVIDQDDFSLIFTYNNFGSVGLQNVQIDSAIGLTTWTYFDGLGRTIVEKKTGPAGKTIVTETKYNPTGTVAQVSLPYFNVIDTPVWTSFSYDSLGRVTEKNNPDGTRTSICYNINVTSTVDPEKHRKRETKDSSGKIIRADEYLGTYETCATEVGTLYATTLYDYDTFGNLQLVTDAEGNKTEMHYDSLGRKDWMRDPNMGYWTYEYDANGNLHKQIDAKGQTLTFSHDELNRITNKDYPTGTDVVYTYDEPSSYSVGRLTTMTDAAGTTKYYYDQVGRNNATEKIIDAQTHTTFLIYDGLGRMTGVVYPDGEIIGYDYDAGGNLAQVIGYATFMDYDALGQPGKIVYSNGASSSTYEYFSTNRRLKTLTTRNAVGEELLKLSYDYYDDGTIKSILDNNDASKSQWFIYDDLGRLKQAQSAIYDTLVYNYDQIGNIIYKEGVTYKYDVNGDFSKPHAVKSTTNGTSLTAYSYDDNGNMISDGTRTIAYDFDNKPVSVTLNGATASFTYDGNGARVKKTTQAGTTIYIDKLYECRNSACSKYIFAGNTRIALKSSPTDILYYHQDHLGSSRVVTDGKGAKKEAIFYYPFGATRDDTGTVSVNHKFTSQELDPETGLYYYNARYYDPVLGRFISPDSIVSNMYDSQELNRYAYARNNPLSYTDPSGHSFSKWWKRRHKEIIASVVLVASLVLGPTGPTLWGAFTGAAIGGYSADQAGGNIFKGMLFGAAYGAAGGAITGSMPFSDMTVKQLGFWGTMGRGLFYGTVQGTAFGSAVGYAGGQGDTRAILRGSAFGAGTGAVTGLVLGGIDYYTGGKLNFGANKMTKEKFLQENLPNAAKELAEKNVIGAISQGLGIGVSQQTFSAFNIGLLGTSAAYAGGLTVAAADIYLYSRYMGCRDNLASGGTCNIGTFKVKFDESKMFSPSDYDITNIPVEY